MSVAELSWQENLYKMSINMNAFFMYLNILGHTKLSTIDKVGFRLLINDEVHCH